jgi:hypothetical protein
MLSREDTHDVILQCRQLVSTFQSKRQQLEIVRRCRTLSNAFHNPSQDSVDSAISNTLELKADACAPNKLALSVDSSLRRSANDHSLSLIDNKSNRPSGRSAE